MRRDERFHRFASAVATIAMVGASFLQGGIASAATLSGFTLGGNHWTDGAQYAHTGDISIAALPGTGLAEGEHLFLTFDSGFTITDNANYAYCWGSHNDMIVEPVSGQTIELTADVGGCSGRLNSQGIVVTNPATPGTHSITLSTDSVGGHFDDTTLTAAYFTPTTTTVTDTLSSYLPGATNVTHTVTVVLPNSGLTSAGENILVHFPNTGDPDYTTYFPIQTATASCTTQTGTLTEGDDYWLGGDVDFQSSGTCSGTMTFTLTGTNPVAGTYPGVVVTSNSDFARFLASSSSDIVIAPPSVVLTDHPTSFLAGATATHDLRFTLPSAGLSPGDTFYWSTDPGFVNTAWPTYVACTVGGLAQHRWWQQWWGERMDFIVDGNLGCHGDVIIEGIQDINPATPGAYNISVSDALNAFAPSSYVVNITAPALSAVTDTLSNNRPGYTGTQDISLIMPEGGIDAGETLTLAFPDFAIDSSGVTAGCSLGGGFSTVADDGHNLTLTAAVGGCDGTVTINGLNATNPDLAEFYYPTISSNHAGFVTTYMRLLISGVLTATDTLSDTKAGLPALHNISIQLPHGHLAHGEVLSIAFPSDFSLAAGPASVSCPITGGEPTASVNLLTNSLDVTAVGGCGDTLNVTDLPITNPLNPGTYTVNVTSDQAGYIPNSFDVNIDSASPGVGVSPDTHAAGAAASYNLDISMPPGWITGSHVVHVTFPSGFVISTGPTSAVCDTEGTDPTVNVNLGTNSLDLTANGGCQGVLHIVGLPVTNAQHFSAYNVTVTSDQPGFLAGTGGVTIYDSPTSIVDTIDLTSAGVNALHVINFDLPYGGLDAGHQLNVMLGPDQVTDLAASATCATGGFSAQTVSGFNLLTLTAGPSGCSGHVTITDLPATNLAAGPTNFSGALYSDESGFSWTSFDMGTTGFIPQSSATTVNSVTLSRLKIDTVATVDLRFHLADTLDGTLTVTFPAGFEVLSAPTGGSSCLSRIAFTSSTITALKNLCTGDLFLTGATVQNPHDPGSYIINWINDTPGSAAVYIILDDQVSITASVEPSISFDVGAQSASVPCSGSFAGDGGVVALGIIPLDRVVSSDVNLVNHICTRLSTNAAHGAIVTVKSLHAALQSGSTPGDVIPSLTANGGDNAMHAGTANYGLCADGVSGIALTDPESSPVLRNDPFHTACTDGVAAGNVGNVTTSAQAVWHVEHATSNAYQNLEIKAAISGTTAAHSDYGDTLTFVATGTF